MKKGFKTFCNPTTTNHHRNETRSQTLEELILQLDLEEEEEELARKANTNSDNILLESARNIALSQYPRFSLDGRDAMYRSSFRNVLEPGRKSVCSDTARFYREKRSTFAGERVMWCKPGVVATLMGLDAMPVPIKGQQRRELEKRRLAMDVKSRQKIGLGKCCVVKSPSEPATNNNNNVAASGGWPTRRHFY